MYMVIIVLYRHSRGEPTEVQIKPRGIGGSEAFHQRYKKHSQCTYVTHHKMGGTTTVHVHTPAATVNTCEVVRVVVMYSYVV